MILLGLPGGLAGLACRAVREAPRGVGEPCALGAGTPGMSRALAHATRVPRGLAGVPEMGEDRHPWKSDAAPASAGMDPTGAAPDELVMGPCSCLEYQALGGSGPPHSSRAGCVLKVGSSIAVCAVAGWFCARPVIAVMSIARRPAAGRRDASVAVPPTVPMQGASGAAAATGSVSAGTGCAGGRGRMRRLLSRPPVVLRKKP